MVVDGVFFAVRQSLFRTVKFDEATIDGFRFHDLDLCMQVRRASRIMVALDILVKYQAGGSFDATWRKYADRFVERYRNDLTASYINDIPNLSRRKPFKPFDLKGKAPQVTIA